MEVSKQRLRDDILENGSFGKEDHLEGNGRTVLTGTEADKNARDYFVNTLDKLDLDIKIDPVGNIAGIWVPDTASQDSKLITVGSHLDSVPNGGIFDGPLGVYAGVEAIRAIQQSAYSPTCPIQVISFTEEEGGRFDVGLLGSSVVGGQRNKEEVLSLTDDQGVSVQAALDSINFCGTDTLSPSDWKSWIELHIEQGTVLEREQVPVGVVTAITGITNCKIRITGEANHAGSTLMKERSDALVAASEFVKQVQSIAVEISNTESEFVAATVGEFDVEPNVRNVIPGKVSLSIDIRDTDSSIINFIIKELKKRISKIEEDYEVDSSFEVYRRIKPVSMTEQSQQTLLNISEQCGVETLSLPSGGGHDTMNMENKTQIGMLFARSQNGVSHSPHEWTSWEDCKKATQVLANTIVDLSCESG